MTKTDSHYFSPLSKGDIKKKRKTFRIHRIHFFYMPKLYNFYVWYIFKKVIFDFFGVMVADKCFGSITDISALWRSPKWVLRRMGAQDWKSVWIIETNQFVIKCFKPRKPTDSNRNWLFKFCKVLLSWKLSIFLLFEKKLEDFWKGQTDRLFFWTRLYLYSR